MTRYLSLLVLAGLVGACSPEDPTGTWTGSTQTSVLGVRTSYEIDIDLERDDGKNLLGEGILVTGGAPIDVTIQGKQKRRKIEFEIYPVDTDAVSFLTTKYKGKIEGDAIDGELSVGVSLAKVKGDMILSRQ